MAKVRAQVEEVIPTAKFANVRINLEIEAEHTEYVESDDPEEFKEALRRSFDAADEVLQEKREPIIRELNEGNL